MVPTPCGRATMDVVAPLRDFRFLQTGTGPVADRAGAVRTEVDTKVAD